MTPREGRTPTARPESMDPMTSCPMAPRDKKEAQLKSTAGHGDGLDGKDGFTLLEVVCVIAILAILAAFATPLLPYATSRARLESYALATAALLKADQRRAFRRQ